MKKNNNNNNIEGDNITTKNREHFQLNKNNSISLKQHTFLAT